MIIHGISLCSIRYATLVPFDTIPSTGLLHADLGSSRTTKTRSIRHDIPEVLCFSIFHVISVLTLTGFKPILVVKEFVLNDGYTNALETIPYDTIQYDVAKVRYSDSLDTIRYYKI